MKPWLVRSLARRKPSVAVNAPQGLIQLWHRQQARVHPVTRRRQRRDQIQPGGQPVSLILGTVRFEQPRLLLAASPRRKSMVVPGTP